MTSRIIAMLLLFLACVTVSARADDHPLSLNVFKSETKRGPAKGWREVRIWVAMKNTSAQPITISLLHLAMEGANGQRYYAVRVVPSSRFQVTVPAHGSTGFDVPRVVFNIPSEVAISHLDLLGPGRKPAVRVPLALPASH